MIFDVLNRLFRNSVNLLFWGQYSVLYTIWNFFPKSSVFSLCFCSFCVSLLAFRVFRLCLFVFRLFLVCFPSFSRFSSLGPLSDFVNFPPPPWGKKTMIHNPYFFKKKHMVKGRKSGDILSAPPPCFRPFSAAEDGQLQGFDKFPLLSTTLETRGVGQAVRYPLITRGF